MRGEEEQASAAVEAVEAKCAVEERAARKLRMRKHVVDELVRTERQYIQALQQLIEIGNALEHARLVDAPQKRTLFGDLQQIVATNMHFLQTLEERVRYWSDVTSTVGDIVLELAPLFRSYIPYVRSFGGKYAEVSRLAESDGWPRFVKNNQVRDLRLLPLTFRANPSHHLTCPP